MNIFKWLWIRTFCKRKYQAELIKRRQESELYFLRNGYFMYKKSNDLWKRWFENPGKFSDGE